MPAGAADAIPELLTRRFTDQNPNLHVAGSFAEAQALSHALLEERTRFNGLPVWTSQPAVPRSRCAGLP